MSTHRLTLCIACLIAGFAAVPAPLAQAQVATLGKGHTILLNNGLQIWGLDQGAWSFNYNNLENANFTGVMWSWGIDPAPHPKLTSLSAGQKWGKWTDPNGNPATALDAIELSRKADLIALQVGDEQQTDIEDPNGVTRAWFQAAHAGNYFPDQLLYPNSFYINSDAAYADFVAHANPDAISFDSYPFNDPYGKLILPQNWLALAGRFRRHALSSYLGIGNNTPRPYGLYLQTYESTSEGARHPGDLEMRWQQFTAWTMGFTFVDAFTVGSASSLFNGGNMNSPSEPRYSQFKETARQSRNLGPALVRLISHGYGPSIVLGRDAAGNSNPVPADWLVFNKNNAPVAQQYLTDVSAANLGTKHNGQAGDVYIGYFNPLHSDFGNPAGTAYFMVTNALGAYLNDASLSVADTAQRITLDFDFGYTTINSLQRLRRSDGQVETIPLTHVSGSKYQLVFDLEGGTGDLFKFNDGHVFVGAEAVMPTVYWDNDGNSANNNLASGSGLGGSGNWDGSSNKWYDGTSNGPWVAHRNPVFWGTAGTVNIVAPPSVDSLSFKSNGYTISGSSLTLNRPFITVDAGVTATISSVIAGSTGLTKSGEGTLRLTGTNTYSGGTTINEGVVQVISDNALGAAPTTFRPHISLNGGTLQWGANFDLHNNRGISIGPNGGALDTQGFSNPSGYNAPQGGFRGPGDLTKLGSGTFFASATTGGANSTWTGRLIIKEGTWRIVASDGLPYNVPVADGLQAAQVTLDGGTWQMAATANITNARRGITVASGGGTIDTQEFTLTWAGPLAGGTTAVLNKIGSGLLHFTGTTYQSSYSGAINVNAGTLRLSSGNAIGSTAAINLANAAGAMLNITNNVAIGSLAGGGTSGGNVTLSSMLTTGGNDNSTTFSGIISGAGGLTKTGSGTLRLAGQNTYTGATVVAGGTLAVDGRIMGSAIVQNGAKLTGAGNVLGTLTVQAGGILAPGNSPGTIALGGLAMQNNSALRVDLGSTSDQVIVNNTASLNGTLEVSLLGGFAPNLGDSFTVLTANAVTGVFSTELLPSFSNRTFEVIYNSQYVVLRVVPLVPGDFTGDSKVDAADYVLWRKSYEASLADHYDRWRANFGGEAGGKALSTSVPEPAAWMIYGLGGAMLLTGRWPLAMLQSRLAHP